MKTKDIDTQKYIAKKYNLDLSQIPEDKYIHIPETGRADLTKLFAELNFKTGAEIGVHTGSFTMQIFRDNPKIHFYAVDPWTIYDDYVDFPNAYQLLDANHDFVKHLKKEIDSKNCEIIRKPSMEAVKYFKDESLDFVYIDANHLLKFVIEDIFEWSKKVRRGGIISGHDFITDKSQLWWCHVYQALNAYIACYNLDCVFVMGVNRRDDTIRSWFFIKK